MKMTKEEFQILLDEQNENIECYIDENDNLIVTNNLIVNKSFSVDMPDNFIKSSGGIEVHQSATLTAPNLATSGSIDVHQGATLTAPNLATSGWIRKEAESKRQVGIKNGDLFGADKNILYADGIFIIFKSVKEIQGIKFYQSKFKHTISCATDGTYWAHGKSLKICISDLMFKSANDRGADQYKGIDINKYVSFEQAVIMYRIITGACSGGIESFISGLQDVKDEYSPNEIIELTKGQHGNDVFRRFFDV